MELIRVALAVINCVKDELLRASDPDEIMEVLAGVSHGITRITKVSMDEIEGEASVSSIAASGWLRKT